MYYHLLLYNPNHNYPNSMYMVISNNNIRDASENLRKLRQITNVIAFSCPLNSREEVVKRIIEDCREYLLNKKTTNIYTDWQEWM